MIECCVVNCEKPSVLASVAEDRDIVCEERAAGVPESESVMRRYREGKIQLTYTRTRSG
jgi:hypothetical protein